MSEPRRRSPEELLRELQAEERDVVEGRLKVFLGYASGVGKSFRMLDEARRRAKRGQDVAVVAVQPKVSAEVAAILQSLESIPTLQIDGAEAIDMNAVLRRRPSVCVIDGLAYSNPPGSRNATRWQDAEELIRAGVSVLASINIQYIEELREEAEALTGKSVRQTVPLAFIKSAREIEVVDTPPEAPIERTREQEADYEGRQERLSRLREMALVVAADVVDHQLVEYLRANGIAQHYGAQERILVCLSPSANAASMIDAARKLAARFHGEWHVVYVRQTCHSNADREVLEQKLAMAKTAGAKTEILDGADPVEAILTFAQSRGITQLYIGHSHRPRWWSRLRNSSVDRLIRDAKGMDIRVFPQ